MLAGFCLDASCFFKPLVFKPMVTGTILLLDQAATGRLKIITKLAAGECINRASGSAPVDCVR